MSILTPAEFAALRPEISRGWQKEEKKIQQHIDSAEDVDLYDVLGSFYFKLLEEIANVNYSDLLNGSTFTFEGIPMKHEGIKHYIAGLTYSRYLGKVNAVHTSHGYVTKRTQDGDPVNYQQVAAERKDVDITNEIRFQRIDAYLKSEAVLFPEYNTGNNPTISTNEFKTSNLR